jgi:AcrR family transcriptional regulator
MSNADEGSGQRYAGVAFEVRKDTRRRQLLDAALQLLDGEGFAAVTARRVCKEAGLNNRYFYESFTDIEALLDAQVDRLEQGLVHNIAGIDDLLAWK